MPMTQACSARARMSCRRLAGTASIVLLQHKPHKHLRKGHLTHAYAWQTSTASLHVMRGHPLFGVARVFGVFDEQTGVLSHLEPPHATHQFSAEHTNAVIMQLIHQNTADFMKTWHALENMTVWSLRNIRLDRSALHIFVHLDCFTVFSSNVNSNKVKLLIAMTFLKNLLS